MLLYCGEIRMCANDCQSLSSLLERFVRCLSSNLQAFQFRRFNSAVTVIHSKTASRLSVMKWHMPENVVAEGL